MSTVEIEDTLHQRCDRHRVLYLPDQTCSRCAYEQAAAQRREIINVLQSRIADQDASIARLCRQVADLQHQRESDLKAHNALAQDSERLESRVEQLLAHSTPNADLLP
jgi:chromosome segregation ATPase